MRDGSINCQHSLFFLHLPGAVELIANRVLPVGDGIGSPMSVFARVLAMTQIYCDVVCYLRLACH